MIDSGVLTDYTSDKDDIEKELEKVTVKSSVDQELAKLKAERDKKQKKEVTNTETVEVKETDEESQRQEEEEVHVTS